MTCLENREITLTSTPIYLEENVFKTYYGIKIQEGVFIYENKFISTRPDHINFLICKLKNNDVSCVHIRDVVNDFLLEHSLN